MAEWSRRNWRNVRVDLRSIAAPTLTGPYEVPFDYLRVFAGSASTLWLVDTPVAVDDLPTLGYDTLLDFGVNLNADNLCLPVRFDRWWLIAGAAPVAVTVLQLFWDVHVPVTR